MDSYCKVLIIDDEFIMRQGIKHMLNWEKEGFQVVGEATNGQEGLDLIAQLKPHIVLADIVMPVLDGIEFSKIVKERHPDVQLIILSSYDKFEYVKETLLNGAIDYILKPSMESEMLLKTLRKAVDNIPGMILKSAESASPANQLERILSGYQDSADEAVFAQVFCHTQYMLAAVNLKTMCENNRTRMATAEREICEELKSCPEFVNVPLFLNEELLCMVFNFRLVDERFLHTQLELCARKTAEIYQNTFFVAGNSFTSVRCLKESFQKEILPYADRRFYYAGQYLLTVKEAKKIKETGRFEFDKYTNSLIHKQFQRALEMFEEYIRDVLEAQTDEYKVKNLTKNLLYNYLMEIECYDVPSEELRQMYFKKIDEAGDVETFENELLKAIEHLRMIVKNHVEEEDEKITEMKNYIARHYNEELDLKELSDTFGFNYHYLSSYFNQHTKEGFSGYLNKIRIEKACARLLAGTDTIAQVSQQTGYSDHSYFCRVFKKITGYTPSEYRRKKRKGDRV